jgi:hypothetical protein
MLRFDWLDLRSREYPIPVLVELLEDEPAEEVVERPGEPQTGDAIGSHDESHRVVDEHVAMSPAGPATRLTSALARAATLTGPTSRGWYPSSSLLSVRSR